ncbi:hypothetical protein J3R74_001991 [Puniceicoccus vermicola]
MKWSVEYQSTKCMTIARLIGLALIGNPRSEQGD